MELSFAKTKKNKGFTLAEVLITLVVIGVIAALTIPNLIQGMYDQQYKAGVKRAYSALEQATITIMMNNGGTMLNFATNATDSRDLYLQYMPAVKTCYSINGPYNPSDGCGESYCNYFNNTDFPGSCSGSGGGFAALNNGMFLLFNVGLGSGDPVTCDPYCGYLYIDINGYKDPNKWNKDIFSLLIKSNKLTPDASMIQFLKQ